MFRINTLGKFQIVGEEATLDEEGFHSAMLTKLMLLLLTHREQNLSNVEIIMGLWQEDMDNPPGALKNLVYRLRSLLKKHFGDLDFIITRRGAYCWNPEIKVEIDAERFEELVILARRQENQDLAIQYYEEAFQLYRGYFMATLKELHWIVTLSTHYHSMYVSALKDLAEIYIKEEMFDKLENLCKEAFVSDHVDELLHSYITFTRTKNYKQKKEKKESSAEGVFFCEYSIFREIHRLEARKLAKTGGIEYILLLTVKQEHSNQMETQPVETAMEGLEQIIHGSLRLGDVAAKYSDSQYVILLPTCSYQTGMLVAERVVSDFYQKNPTCSNMQVGIDLEKVADSSIIVK